MKEILLSNVLELIIVSFLHKDFIRFNLLPGTLLSIEMVVWRTVVLPIYQTKMPHKSLSSICRQKLLPSYDRSAVLRQICHKTTVGLYWNVICTLLYDLFFIYKVNVLVSNYLYINVCAISYLHNNRINI